jgi:catechol 2,3-dioxygenase-like lactoylglutathione lyase family enzyme
MGILTDAEPAIIICTRDRERSAAFYRDVVGLEPAGEDRFATLFLTGGVSLRVSTVEDFVAHEHTVLGFRVPDVEAAVRALSARGISFNRYEKFAQDDLGIFTMSEGKVRVAWFNDPDGNLLSVSNV